MSNLITSVNYKKPKHVAVIMDGNGRWANNKGLPRYKGHLQGAKAAETIVKAALENNVEYMTLFAFSSENINRPNKEVLFLKKLYYHNLSTRLNDLNEQDIKLKFIGDLSFFSQKLIDKTLEAEELTINNKRLTLCIALNYGGRWDVVQACNKIIQHKLIANDNVNTNADISEAEFNKYLATSDMPDPDLFIRTSGEMRISNFLLWQLAYTELYFSDKYWPDFNEDDFNLALNNYASRNRRFGLTESRLYKT